MSTGHTSHCVMLPCATACEPASHVHEHGHEPGPSPVQSHGHGAPLPRAHSPPKRINTVNGRGIGGDQPSFFVFPFVGMLKRTHAQLVVAAACLLLLPAEGTSRPRGEPLTAPRIRRDSRPACAPRECPTTFVRDADILVRSRVHGRGRLESPEWPGRMRTIACVLHAFLSEV